MNRKSTIIVFILAYCVGGLLESCRIPFTKKPYVREWDSLMVRSVVEVPPAMYTRDSLALTIAMYQMANKYYPYIGEGANGKWQDERTVFRVDTILYSPDTLELFATAINRIPFTMEEKQRRKIEADYFFSGRQIVGLRQTTHEPWIFWVIPTLRMVLPTYERVSNAQHTFFFSPGDKKNYLTFPMLESWRNHISVPYKYYADEVGFWTGHLFQKVEVGKGYYYTFQPKLWYYNIKENRKGFENYIDDIVFGPHFVVQYPDSVREMYH